MKQKEKYSIIPIGNIAFPARQWSTAMPANKDLLLHFHLPQLSDSFNQLLETGHGDPLGISQNDRVFSTQFKQFHHQCTQT